MQGSLRKIFPGISIQSVDLTAECKKVLYPVDVCQVDKFDKLMKTDRFEKKYIFIPYYPSAYNLVEKFKTDIISKEFKFKEK